ncbi:helix-turn-helix domain-containing protein [Rhodococcus sp. NPDC060084]|uniref:helix-turn-helix domain-containing protein n=1 Tax=Rhodococcus sp. NPDC060084 TaxID=3347053 RepID=UPI00366580F5
MGLHEDLDALLGIQDTDGYGKLRDRLVDADDCLLESLVTLRKQKRLTQEEVALRMGRSKTAVSNFERLGSDPHLSTIRRYAAAIGALVTHQVRDYDIWRMTSTEPLTLTFRHLNSAEGKERPKAAPAAGMHWKSMSSLDWTACDA